MAGGNRIEKGLAAQVINIAKLPSEFYHEFLIFTRLGNSPLVLENTVDNLIIEPTDGFILVSTVNQTNHLAEIQLLNLRSLQVIQRWQPEFSQLENTNISNANIRLTHPLLFHEDVITNANGLLIRLNKKSGIVWKNNGNFHHSIELDAEKNLWVCGTIPPRDTDNIIESNILDDAIIKIDALTGKTIFTKSIYEILIENGYQSLLFNMGPITEDLIHINDIQPALNSSQYWQKGDLLISLRNRSSILLYRPSTNKVVWLKTGPWNFQHDCDFISDTEIGVFGNDVTDFKGKSYLIKGHNNQYIYNFSTNEISTPYTKMFKQGKIKTLTEGRSRILPDGQLLVEETNYGRILFGDKNGITGEYVNRLDKNHISMLSWSRYYTNEEFNQSNN